MEKFLKPSDWFRRFPDLTGPIEYKSPLKDISGSKLDKPGSVRIFLRPGEEVFRRIFSSLVGSNFVRFWI